MDVNISLRCLITNLSLPENYISYWVSKKISAALAVIVERCAAFAQMIQITLNGAEANFHFLGKMVSIRIIVTSNQFA